MIAPSRRIAIWDLADCVVDRPVNLAHLAPAVVVQLDRAHQFTLSNALRSIALAKAAKGREICRTGRPGGTLVATPARGFGARRLAPSTGFRKTALVPEG